MTKSLETWNLDSRVKTQKKIIFHVNLFFFFLLPTSWFSHKPKQPTCWWRFLSLSIKPRTFLNSSTWQGIVMVPFWSNPYSSSASFNSWMKRGWLKYITGTTNLCCSSPRPTFIAINPFGTPLNSCLCWRWCLCKWRLFGLFSTKPIFAKPKRNTKRPKYSNFEVKIYWN